MVCYAGYVGSNILETRDTETMGNICSLKHAAKLHLQKLFSQNERSIAKLSLTYFTFPCTYLLNCFCLQNKYKKSQIKVTYEA